MRNGKAGSKSGVARSRAVRRRVNSPFGHHFSTLGGVALAEILVSISILVFAMVLMAQYVFRGIDEVAMSHRRSEGLLLAQERMEDLLAHREDLEGWQQRTRQGYKIDADALKDTAQRFYHFSPERKLYRWRWQIQPTDEPGLREVAVWVHWRLPQGPAFKSFCELRSLVAVPSE